MQPGVFRLFESCSVADTPGRREDSHPCSIAVALHSALDVQDRMGTLLLHGTAPLSCPIYSTALARTMKVPEIPIAAPCPPIGISLAMKNDITNFRCLCKYASMQAPTGHLSGDESTFVGSMKGAGDGGPTPAYESFCA